MILPVNRGGLWKYKETNAVEEEFGFLLAQYLRQCLADLKLTTRISYEFGVVFICDLNESRGKSNLI